MSCTQLTVVLDSVRLVAVLKHIGLCMLSREVLDFHLNSNVIGSILHASIIIKYYHTAFDFGHPRGDKARLAEAI